MGASVLLHFVPAGGFNPPIGDSRCHDCDIDRQRRLAGGEHFLGCLNRHDSDPGRCGLLCRPRDEHRVGAESGECGGDRMALLA